MGQQQQRQNQQLGTGAQSPSTGASGRLPQQFRQSLDAVSQAVQVCGWCADQCITTADPSMIECIRTCEDVVELGETLLAITPRSSPFTPTVAQTFVQAAQACAQECGQHGASHCQECASVLEQTIPSVQQLSGSSWQQSGVQRAQGASGMGMRQPTQ
jgi:hypothetical protein